MQECGLQSHSPDQEHSAFVIEADADPTDSPRPMRRQLPLRLCDVSSFSLLLFLRSFTFPSHLHHLPLRDSHTHSYYVTSSHSLSDHDASRAAAPSPTVATRFRRDSSLFLSLTPPALLSQQPWPTPIWTRICSPICKASNPASRHLHLFAHG